MGASQSSERDAGEQVVKTSYYELLGVERQATDDEIKKAYRRKALELHPDRNYGNEEEATRIFSEVQAAYGVLSDPQERAWYDSHESAILRGDDGAGPDEAPAYQNIRITTADDLARMVRKFNTNVKFDDSPSGFFGFIRETFEHLAEEEEVAAAWENVEAPDYPTFGHRDDGYDDVVRRFYSAWSNFSTVKSFAWKDKYRLSDAPDRWYRRRMEQENKAFRKEGIKEFNEAVRSLVAFVRKRDPRYVPSTQSEAERQKVLRDAAASQAARARAENQAKLNQAVPDWAKTREPEELEESEEEDVEEEVLECVACNKVFKSERQFDAHARSKKHQKAVHALQKKMRKENAHLDLDSSQPTSGAVTPEVHDEEEQDILDDLSAEVANHDVHGNAQLLDDDQHRELDDVDEQPSNERESAKPEEANSDEAAASEDSDYASMEAIQSRLQESNLHTPPTTISDVGDEAEEKVKSDSAQPKKGKAAQKRAKKAAAAAVAEEAANTHRCATCNATFPSKTRLFQHIKDHGHAAPKAMATGGGKGKKASTLR